MLREVSSSCFHGSLVPLETVEPLADSTQFSLWDKELFPQKVIGLMSEHRKPLGPKCLSSHPESRSSHTGGGCTCWRQCRDTMRPFATCDLPQGPECPCLRSGLWPPLRLTSGPGYSLRPLSTYRGPAGRGTTPRSKSTLKPPPIRAELAPYLKTKSCVQFLPD